MRDKTPRYVIVELSPEYDYTGEAASVAASIAHNIESVERATPAYDDGFGHLVELPEQRVIGTERS